MDEISSLSPVRFILYRQPLVVHKLVFRQSKGLPWQGILLHEHVFAAGILKRLQESPEIKISFHYRGPSAGWKPSAISLQMRRGILSESSRDPLAHIAACRNHPVGVSGVKPISSG